MRPRAAKESSMAFYKVQITTEGRDIRTVRKQYPQASVVKIEMNKSRSDRLTDARSLIEDAQSDIDELREEMTAWFENLPESFQEGEKGSALEETAEKLGEAFDAIDEATSALDDVEFPGMYS